MKSVVVVLIVLILAVTDAVAQTTGAVPPPASPAVVTQPAAKPGEQAPVEAVIPIPIGTRVGESISTYDSRGRRDPFTSLIVARRARAESAEPGLRMTGLAALPLADVFVTGLTRVGDNYLASVEGPDKQSFTVRVKDRLLDAVVKSIDAKGVVFVEQSDGAGPGREIRKTIRRGEVNR